MHEYQKTGMLIGCVMLTGAVALTAFAPASLSVQESGPASAARPQPAPAASWLLGTVDEKLAQIERHLRGLDVSMAEISYRYGELLFAAKTLNWQYAQYQTEKIELSLRLAIERRPLRAKSAQPFLDESLPPVLTAIKAQDDNLLTASLEQLHAGCVQCHQAENVLYFKESVDRIKARSQ
jgi:hypothetical protein